MTTWQKIETAPKLNPPISSGGILQSYSDIAEYLMMLRDEINNLKEVVRWILTPLPAKGASQK